MMRANFSKGENHMVTRTGTIAIAAAAMVVAGTPANAQYMMHLDPNLYMMVVMNMNSGPNTCLTGIALPDKEVDEARLPAPAVMQGYFAAAQGSGSKSASFRQSEKAQWSHGTTVAPLAQIDAQRDPLAAAGNRLDPDALRFFRAGDAQTAQGQWLVTRADGVAAGLYDAVFKREKSVWKLERLTVHGAADPVAPAMQYCAKPGDVTEHMVKSAVDRIAYIEKEITKAEEKLVAAKAKLAADEAALSAKPDRSNLKETVRLSREQLDRREKKLIELRKNLADAREYQDNANRDKAELAAMTLPAAEAQRFRGFETTTAKDRAAKKAKEDAEKKAAKGS
jgi:hypothetical protein